jgi:hypothetical protein
LSSRATNRECRKCLSGVHSTNSNCPTSKGFSHRQSFIFAAVSPSPHLSASPPADSRTGTPASPVPGTAGQLLAHGRSEPAPGPRDIEKPLALPIPEDQRVEVPAAQSVAADHELLRPVDAHFGPGAGAFPRSYLLSRRFATSPSRPCSFTERIRFGRLASRMGEYRIGSAGIGRTCFSISARRWTRGSPITSRPRRINRSNMKKCSGRAVGARRSPFSPSSNNFAVDALALPVASLRMKSAHGLGGCHFVWPVNSIRQGRTRVWMYTRWWPGSQNGNPGLMIGFRIGTGPRQQLGEEKNDNSARGER